MKKRKRTRRTRLKERHRLARIIKLFILIVLALGATLGFSRLSNSNWAKIQSIKVVGNSLVAAKEIENLAKKETAAPILKIFRTDNILLYPKEKVEKNIAESFKSIKRVNISFKTPKELEIRIIEREPVSLWCAARERFPENCFFMDEAGLVFAKAPAFSGNIFFVYYGLLDKKDPIGKIYLSRERLKSLKTFVESVKTLGAKPVSLNAESEEDYELFLSPSGRILFNTKLDFLKTFENLEAIADRGVPGSGARAGSAAARKNFFSELDYVDLRFGFKAFFKLK